MAQVSAAGAATGAAAGSMIAPGIGTLIGGALGAGADIFSAFSQSGANKQQIAAQKEIAQKQMDFQREMSNTAHTREVADLRNAGLNPILSATGGSGASTPAGATAQIPNAWEGVGQNINSAGKMIQDSFMTASNIGLNSALTLKAANEAKISSPKANIMNTANDLINSAKDLFHKALSGIQNMSKPHQGRKITVENAQPQAIMASPG